MPFDFNEIWKEVFKTGTHTDAYGHTMDWSESIIDKIVDKYNNQKTEEKHDAPIVIGHPTTTAPAYGWVEKLRRSGKILMAKFRDVDEGFKELVNAGRYQKISIKLTPELLLKHVGFLGAVAPAVKGLALPTFDFTNTEENITTLEINKFTFTYQEATMPENLNNFFKDLLNGIATKYNAEMATQIKSDIDDLTKKYKLDETPAAAPAVTAEEQPPASPAFSESAEYKAQQEKIKKLEAGFTSLEKENREMKFNEIFSGLLNANGKAKVMPAQKQDMRNLYDLYLESNKPFEFQEGDKSVKLSGEAAFKKYVNSLPDLLEYNEFATNGNAFNQGTSQIEEDKKIEEFNKERGF